MRPFPPDLERAVGRSVRVASRLLGLVLLAMVALNVANAAGRHVLQRSILGADEILVFAMAWLVFGLGAALALLRLALLLGNAVKHYVMS